ncbi:MAG: Wzz/FepE/Etk N-terminal domain-containing protein, partial [Aeromicrobium sp.]
MDLRQFLSTVRRHWKLVLVVFLLGVGGASAITASTTPLYASTARLFVGTSAGARVDPYAGALFSQQRATSYADLGLDSTVLQRVVDKLDLGVSAGELAAHITITAVPSSVILEVRATATNPY